MVSSALITELQQILVSDFGINVDNKQTNDISADIIKYFELLISMKNHEKFKVSVKK